MKGFSLRWMDACGWGGCGEGNRGALCFAGYVALCFWLQFSLQNLYIACTYADHTTRTSTLLTGVFLSCMVLCLAGLLAASALGRRAPFAAAGRVLTVATAVLLLIQALVAAEYRLATTMALSVCAGCFTAVACLRWGCAPRGESVLGALGETFAANVVALVLLLLLFGGFGQVVWLDLPLGWHKAALVAVLEATVVAVHVLCPPCPEPDGEGPVAVGPQRRAAWRNALLGQGRLFAGLALLTFGATLHWEINAMRYGNAFDVAWDWFGHRVEATPMAACFIVLLLAVLVVALVLMRLVGDRAHPRTLLTVAFYAVGCAFFVPGLLGFEAASSAGVTMVGMVLFCMCAAVLLCRARSVLEVPLAALVALFWLTVCVGLGLGLLVSWAIAPDVSGSAVFCMALVALSLFVVMVAPSLLFSANTPATETGAEVAEPDRVAARCRALALEHQLSPRETEVMELAARGYSAPAIATTLFISENTVKVHMRHIYDKVGVHTKQGLIELVEG